MSPVTDGVVDNFNPRSAFNVLLIICPWGLCHNLETSSVIVIYVVIRLNNDVMECVRNGGHRMSS